MPSPLILSRSMPLRLASFSLFYFAQGVPVGLFTIALPAWLAARGVEASGIATLVAVTSLPWAFKLVAGPFMDRFSFPPMGRRRPWVMAAQGGLALAMLSMAAVTDPATQLGTVITLGFVINCFSAVQDVAVDGMAIDVVPDGERGRANAFMAFGQTVGFSAFGALNGFLLIRFGLPVTALVSALTVTGVFVFIAIARERDGERLLPWTTGQAALAAPLTGVSFIGIFRDLTRAVLLPMSLVLVSVEFLLRAAAGISLSIYPVIAVQELGYSSDQFAYWMGVTGGASAVVGILFGPVIDRFGAARVMMAGLVLGGVTAGGFALAVPLWGNTSLVVAVLAAAQLATQLVFVGMITAFMNICWTKVAATQFAVYMSLANLSRSIGAGLFALIASRVTGAEALLIVCGLLLAAAVVLTRFDPVSHGKRVGALQEV